MPRNRQSPDGPRDQASTKLILAICLLLFGLAVLLRYSIFGFGYGPIVTSEHYNKAVSITRVVLPTNKLPLGCNNSSGQPGGYRLLQDKAEISSELSRFEIPSDSVQQLLVADYSYGDDHFVLVAMQTSESVRTTDIKKAFLTQDNLALVLVGPETGPARRALEQAFFEHVRDEKALRVKLEKLKTAGNATLCFVMDLLVGAFFFVLCLFLAKYFLIVRNVES